MPKDDISSTSTSGYGERYRHVMEAGKELLIQWNLKKLGWRVIHGTGRKLAGTSNSAAKLIKISKHLIAHDDSEDLHRCMDTLRHEVAHALVAENDKKGLPGADGKEPVKGKKIDSHGPEWHAWALRVGAKPERCHAIKFFKEPWIKKCANRCWQQPAMRRKHGEWYCTKMIEGKKCGARIIFVSAEDEPRDTRHKANKKVGKAAKHKSNKKSAKHKSNKKSAKHKSNKKSAKSDVSEIGERKVANENAGEEKVARESGEKKVRESGERNMDKILYSPLTLFPISPSPSLLTSPSPSLPISPSPSSVTLSSPSPPISLFSPPSTLPVNKYVLVPVPIPIPVEVKTVEPATSSSTISLSSLMGRSKMMHYRQLLEELGVSL